MVTFGLAAASKQRMKPRKISVRKKMFADLSMMLLKEV
jgi:hypothetical protein